MVSFFPFCLSFCNNSFPTSVSPGLVVQSVTSPTAVPGVAILIPARSHTFTEIDHEIIFTAILLPSTDSKRVVVSYKGKYLHEVLVNCSAKLAQEKSVMN